MRGYLAKPLLLSAPCLVPVAFSPPPQLHTETTQLFFGPVQWVFFIHGFDEMRVSKLQLEEPKRTTWMKHSGGVLSCGEATYSLPATQNGYQTLLARTSAQKLEALWDTTSMHLIKSLDQRFHNFWHLQVFQKQNPKLMPRTNLDGWHDYTLRLGTLRIWRELRKFRKWGCPSHGHFFNNGFILQALSIFQPESLQKCGCSGATLWNLFNAYIWDKECWGREKVAPWMAYECIQC